MFFVVDNVGYSAKNKSKTEGLKDCWTAVEADPRGHAHASRTRARKVIPVKDMTSVRA